MNIESDPSIDQHAISSGREIVSTVAAGLALLVATGALGATAKSFIDGPNVDVSKITQSVTGNSPNTQTNNK